MNDDPKGQELILSSTDLNAIEQISRAEIDQQIATAKRYPRDLARFDTAGRAMVSQDRSVADECFYALPRDGKVIEGPSIRFAEIIFYAWGNARAVSRIVAEGEKLITAQGAFHDLERNIAISAEVQRRIVTKSNKRFGVDMIVVTGNAASSIARRNAIISGIPKAIWQPIYNHAKAIVAGDVAHLAERKDQAFGYLGKLGVTPDQILAALNLDSERDLKGEHIVILRGLLQGINDKEITLDEAFPEDAVPLVRGAKVDISEALKNGTAPEVVIRTRDKPSASDRRLDAEDIKPDNTYSAGGGGAETIVVKENAQKEPVQADQAPAATKEPAEAERASTTNVEPETGSLALEETDTLLKNLTEELAKATSPEEIAVIEDEFAGAIEHAKPKVQEVLRAAIEESKVRFKGGKKPPLTRNRK